MLTICIDLTESLATPDNLARWLADLGLCIPPEAVAIGEGDPAYRTDLQDPSGAPCGYLTVRSVKTCPSCNGHGGHYRGVEITPEDPCPDCQGSGDLLG